MAAEAAYALYKDVDLDEDNGSGSERGPDAGFALFHRCWNKLEQRLGSKIVIPKEIIWLNGPPGAGKGANMGFIKRIRGLSRSITMSSLLSTFSPAKAIMDRGGLVSDEMVGDALLHAIFDPEHADRAGAIVDGFPRTGIQVSFIEQLYYHLEHKYNESAATPELRHQFPKPSFKVVVLYVDEATSISRQLQRHEKSALHNRKVMEARAGKMMEERETDKSVEKCRMRYSVFKMHYPALTRLQQIMPFSVIDATASLEECEAQIAHELRYQSSLDLDERTYQAITLIPLAREIVDASRQSLVQRLDDYCLSQNETFRQVMHVLYTQTVPLLERTAMSGYAEFVTAQNSVFDRTSCAIDIFIDVLTDRGFSVSYNRKVHTIPVRVEPGTGHVHTRRVHSHVFRITFPGGTVRDVRSMHQEAGHRAIAAAEAPLLTASVIPEHLDHWKKASHRPQGAARAMCAALG